MTRWSKNWRIRIVRPANIKEASQEEQQNQTTTKTILFTSKPACPFKKHKL